MFNAHFSTNKTTVPIETILADRGAITMEVPFMRSYALALVKACHKRGAPAMGGMSALIPIKGDPVANDKALAGNGGWRRRASRCRFF